ncbi:hypothetical protein [Streptomyces sp. NPDC018031]|uniref:hypothetical protein n=1 Tax=Streptomyces sp. NPDC018031 TaxID=3365033 RepID=UPI0037A08A39
MFDLIARCLACVRHFLTPAGRHRGATGAGHTCPAASRVILLVPWDPPRHPASPGRGWEVAPPVGGYAIALAPAYRVATRGQDGRTR